ncbi:MAG: site-specific DNA-methyltransferase [Bryobacteraceae bacterium]|jgi:site-specific DNA-methyltransferase (adenine-specific)
MESRTRIATGDAPNVLRQIPRQSIHTCVTSPPYWLVRDYEVDGQIGLEPTPQGYIDHLIQVFNEVRRTLRNDGTCWVVLGDTYFGSGKGAGSHGPRKETFQFFRKPTEIGGTVKSLALIPERFAIAMTDRGWILRNVIIWHKPNAIPTSVKDRFTVDYEFLFFFVKERKYYFERQLEKSRYPGGKHVHKRPGSKGELINRTVNPTYLARNVVTGEFRNKRCVWKIPTGRCMDAHFAVYPEELIETPIRAGCPEGGIVLDPFCGAGTTAIVCERLGRSFLGIELNPAYVEIAKRRIREAREQSAYTSTNRRQARQS